jgi:hypothetical protein
MVAAVCGLEQALPALRAPAQCTGTASLDQLVYHPRDGLPQFVEPQTSIVGTRAGFPHLRTG